MQTRRQTFEAFEQYEPELGAASLADGSGDAAAQDAGEPQPLAEARELVRSYTAVRPYAVLGGAAALGWVAGGGAGLALRVAGLALLFGLRAVAGAAASEITQQAARAFDRPQGDPEEQSEPV